MKTPRILFFATMAIIVLLTSCVDSIEQPSPSTNSISVSRNSATKAIINQLNLGITRHDIEDYLVYRMNETLDNVSDISRYDIESDVYIFVVNMKDNRWFIFSGDYSSKPLLVEGNDSLDLSGKLSNYMKSFLHAMGTIIKENRCSVSDEVSCNQQLWLSAKKRANNARIRTRDEIDTNEVIEEYFLDTLINTYHPNLTSTSWDPTFPFNEALPIYVLPDRSLAGCTVVSIAQLVYYTHFAFGYPNDTYEDASCSQYYNSAGTPPYTYVFSTPSTTCWNGMGLTAQANYFTTYVKALFALVAQRTNTYFIYDGYAVVGETLPSSIPTALSQFSLAGASIQDYSKDQIIYEINNSRPVLGYGGDALYNTIGHTYLYEGYRWEKVREITNIYDTEGHLLDQNIVYYETFKWHINTGDAQDGHHIIVDQSYYYPYNRKIVVGWS